MPRIAEALSELGEKSLRSGMGCTDSSDTADKGKAPGLKRKRADYVLSGNRRFQTEAWLGICA